MSFIRKKSNLYLYSGYYTAFKMSESNLLGENRLPDNIYSYH